MKKQKIGLIGIGNMGKNHARVLSDLKCLTAIADPNPATHIEAKKYNVPRYDSYLEMIEKEDLTAVVIAVNTKYHKEITIACLEKKLHVLVEKPIANDIVEADDMLEVAKKMNLALMVGHVERFNPAAIKLKDLIDKGEFGHIISINGMRLGIAPPAGTNNCVSRDLVVHDVEFVLQLMEGSPLSIDTNPIKLFPNNCCDSVMITMKYPKTNISLQSNWITPIKIRQLYIIGTKGFATLDYIKQELIIYEKNYTAEFGTDYFQFVAHSASKPKEIFISKNEPLRGELEEFLRICALTKQDYTGVKKAITALQIVSHLPNAI